MEARKSNRYFEKFLTRYPVISGLILRYSFIYISSHAVQSNWGYFVIEKFSWDRWQIGLVAGRVVGVAFAVIQGGLIRIIIPKLGQSAAFIWALALYALGFLVYGIATLRMDDVSGYYYLLLGKYCGSGYSGNHFNCCTHPMSKVNYRVASPVWQVLAAIIGPLIMNGIFAWFYRRQCTVYFPGAAMILGAY
jgi:DHA1 family tetracycline resistance protein-like MFS transporter